MKAFYLISERPLHTATWVEIMVYLSFLAFGYRRKRLKDEQAKLRAQEEEKKSVCFFTIMIYII